jgi:hypothetical protein
LTGNRRPGRQADADDQQEHQSYSQQKPIAAFSWFRVHSRNFQIAREQPYYTDKCHVRLH